jgi:hypothetical protein
VISEVISPGPSSLGLCLSLSLVFSSALAEPVQPRPDAVPSQLQRGLVYLRIQRPGTAAVEHRHLPAQVQILEGAMLDDPGKVSKPLMIERIEVESLPWLVLERQLAVRNHPAASGTLTVQTLQVLDAQSMPANVQLLTGMAGLPACRYAGRADPDVVAIRRAEPDDRQRTKFQDLLRAWRVDRRSLRLEPVAAWRVSCTNPAQGVP